MDKECAGSRHGRFAADSHRFQITFRGSIPGEIDLWNDVVDAAERQGVTVTDYAREALRRRLASNR